MRQRTLVGWNPGRPSRQWVPSTLDQLGKSEKFLEDVLAESPELLGLESRRTGIRGPLHIVRQVSMQTPSGRVIFPDIVMLTGSGHVVVVEVKRSVNPELKDRAVIAQIIDYASSFAALSESQCLELFGEANDASWPELIDRLFPEEPSTDELAEVLLSRMQSGELNLVIACDKIPPGLPEVISGIATQRALGFELDLVEVVPFVCESSPDAEILFVPSTRLSTEIVARTAVTVTYRAGDRKPSTEVRTTSLEDIEQNVRAAKLGENPDAKIWTPQEVEDEFRREGDPATLALLDFVKRNSADGEYLAPGKKVNPIFGFYVRGADSDGTELRRMIFRVATGGQGVKLYLGNADDVVSAEASQLFRSRLKSMLGDQIDVSKKESKVTYEAIAAHWQEFQDLMLWYKQQVESSIALR